MSLKDYLCCLGFFKTKPKDKKNSEGTPLLATATQSNPVAIDPSVLTRITPLSGSPASQNSRTKNIPWNDFTPPLDGVVNPSGVSGDRSERSYTH